MKSKIFLFPLFASCIMAQAQQVTNGPELDNITESTMNRMLDGDNNSFYSLRVKTKGKDAAYYIEKYDKASLKPVFSKDMEIEKDKFTIIQDVEYASDNVYIFIKDYDKGTKGATLSYKTISSSGTVSNKKQEIVFEKAEYYELVDIEIITNPGKTKFLIRISHKEKFTDEYKTDFLLLDSKTMKLLWTKSVKYSRINGLMIDDADNVFYSVNSSSEPSKGLNMSTSEMMYYGFNPDFAFKNDKLAIGILFANANNESIVMLPFDARYYFSNIKFSKNSDNEIVVGGFIKNAITNGDESEPKIGIFSYAINLTDKSVVRKAVNAFDDKFLGALGVNPKQQYGFKYKLDYVFSIGKETYYVGEQYSDHLSSAGNGMEEINSGGNNSNSIGGGNLGYTGKQAVSDMFIYVYMDVIVAKLNAKGEFEWVKNTPLRTNITVKYFHHIFKQYTALASNNSIYILNNENEKNMEIYSQPSFDPKELKNIKANDATGSNFVYTSVSAKDGLIDHKLLFKNENYSFDTILEEDTHYRVPTDIELGVFGKNGDIFIYTENKKKERFSNIVFK